jgi:hypothetical protein
MTSAIAAERAFYCIKAKGAISTNIPSARAEVTIIMEVTSQVNEFCRSNSQTRKEASRSRLWAGLSKPLD